ncbi:TBC-domain-containing protein, partial [Delitschia confertaspora ATCC 74209]
DMAATDISDSADLVRSSSQISTASSTRKSTTLRAARPTKRVSHTSLTLAKNAVGTPTVRKVTKSTQQIVGSLVAATPSVRERTALFDDTPQEPDRVPGALHHSSDENIEHLLERTGPVTLVRQLAGDLAQRDAQITALRRRAEERERVLRRMLQECEVSNMDIEKRLRTLERGREEEDGPGVSNGKRKSDSGLPGTHPEDDIDARLARAMEDEVVEYSGAMHLSVNNFPDLNAESVDSAPELPRGVPKSNWKSLLWNGTTRKSSRATSVSSKTDLDGDAQTRSRASSYAKKTRKPISDDLFVPPCSDGDQLAGAVPTLRRLQSQDLAHANSSTRKSSTSITNWALKMVAGNGTGKSSDKAGSVRGRDRIPSDSTGRAPSTASTRITQSGKGVSSNLRSRGSRVSMGPNGTIKSLNADSTRNTSGSTGAPNMPGRGLSNLGPVEMERILPEESRPPTLIQHHNYFYQSSEYLTDRFGFIYDQRRKKRQSEAAAALAKQKRNSNVEPLKDTNSMINMLGFHEDIDEVDTPTETRETSPSPTRPGSQSSAEQGNAPPTKTWQDYLKLATHPAELLSHTPSAAPITAVETAEATATAPKRVTVAKRGSLPTSSVNPEPSPSRIVSGNAEFATVSPSQTGPSSPISPSFTHQADPVKALLEQLTELHDCSQREKTIKWNEFLRKVRAERKREGESVSSGPKSMTMPEALLGDGEIVGVASLGNKGKVGRAKWQEFRRLVLGGIPVAYRAKIWAECSGASSLRIPGYYDDLVNNGEDDSSIVSQIQMDINRTLTDNIFFRKGPGVRKLNEVLIAYSRRNPEVGYCQGMNLITACLLLIMPTAEDAFWVLATMIENILPQKYYDQQLLTSRADQSVLREYVVELLPKLSAHLDKLDIELEALTFQWFLSVFTDCLSAEALFRVWDVVLCMHDGSTFLFQVALALLKLNERALRDCDSPAGVYHYINHQMTNHAISIDGLIQASDALGKVVKRKDVEERRERAVQREREIMRQREELRQERARKRREEAERRAAGIEEEDGGEVSKVASASSISASLNAELSMHTSPMRTPLSSASMQSEEEEDADLLDQTLEELTNRTPMPMEEESLWRG